MMARRKSDVGMWKGIICSIIKEVRKSHFLPVNWNSGNRVVPVDLQIACIVELEVRIFVVWVIFLQLFVPKFHSDVSQRMLPETCKLCFVLKFGTCEKNSLWQEKN